MTDRRLHGRIASPTLFIARDLYRFGFIFVALPFQAVIFENVSLQFILYTYALELLAILLILLISWARYRSLDISLRDGTPTVSHGLLIKLFDRIFISEQTGISVIKKPLYLPRGDFKLTAVSGRMRADLYLKKRFFGAVTNGFLGIGDRRSEYGKTVSSDVLCTLLISAALSSSLTGVLYIVPFMRAAARLLGEGRVQAVLMPLEQTASSFFSVLPPVLRLISGILLVLWATGMAIRFLHLAGLRLTKSGKLITLRRGVLPVRQTSVLQDGISAVITRRSPISLLTGICCCEALLPTDEKLSAEPLFIGRYRGEKHKLLQSLFYTEEKASAEFKPAKDGVFGYLYPPLILISALGTLCIILDVCSVKLLPEIIFLLLMIPCLSRYFFRLYAYRKSRIRIFSDRISVTTFSGMTLTEISVLKKDLRAVITTQSIPARLHCRCNLTLRIRANRSFRIKLRQISREVTRYLSV